MAKRNHPDLGGSEEEIKLINTAYETLKDPDKRKNYDSYGDSLDNEFQIKQEIRKPKWLERFMFIWQEIKDDEVRYLSQEDLINYVKENRDVIQEKFNHLDQVESGKIKNSGFSGGSYNHIPKVKVKNTFWLQKNPKIISMLLEIKKQGITSNAINLDPSEKRNGKTLVDRYKLIDEAKFVDIIEKLKIEGVSSNCDNVISRIREIFKCVQNNDIAGLEKCVPVSPNGYVGKWYETEDFTVITNAPYIIIDGKNLFSLAKTPEMVKKLNELKINFPDNSEIINEVELKQENLNLLIAMVEAGRCYGFLSQRLFEISDEGDQLLEDQILNYLKMKLSENSNRDRGGQLYKEFINKWVGQLVHKTHDIDRLKKYKDKYDLDINSLDSNGLSLMQKAINDYQNTESNSPEYDKKKNFLFNLIEIADVNCVSNEIITKIGPSIFKSIYSKPITGSNDLEIVKLLRKSGANLEPIKTGNSIINILTKVNQYDIFEYLLSEMKTEFSNDKYLSMVQGSFRDRFSMFNFDKSFDIKFVKKLYEEGADPMFKEYDGKLAILEFFKISHRDFTEEEYQFLEKIINDGKLDLTHKIRGGETILHKLLGSPSQLKNEEAYYTTKLQKPIVFERKLKFIQLIIDKGADVNAYTTLIKKGRFDHYPNFTPLHKAIELGDINNVKILLENGAKVRTKRNSDEYQGVEPLYYAVENNPELVDLLLPHLKGDIRGIQDAGYNGFSAIELASQKGLIETVISIAKHKGGEYNVNHKDKVDDPRVYKPEKSICSVMFNVDPKHRNYSYCYDEMMDHLLERNIFSKDEVPDISPKEDMKDKDMVTFDSRFINFAHAIYEINKHIKSYDPDHLTGYYGNIIFAKDFWRYVEFAKKISNNFNNEFDITKISFISKYIKNK